MDPTALAIATVSVPMLTLLGYGLGQATWQGRVSERLDNLETRQDKSDDKRSDIHARLNAIDAHLAELTGQLKAHGLLK